ncbi:hypothetical protein WJX72_006108 [[Myrmecia] bisecta]|uniref:Uncharacterized protein n=1 Tax=[Myrmecia] bisecta TaxID=41462 RepID=A0AAW1P3H1_9CHLO
MQVHVTAGGSICMAAHQSATALLAAGAPTADPGRRRHQQAGLRIQVTTAGGLQADRAAPATSMPPPAPPPVPMGFHPQSLRNIKGILQCS